jgi:hypothetical protein
MRQKAISCKWERWLVEGGHHANGETGIGLPVEYVRSGGSLGRQPSATYCWICFHSSPTTL